VGKTKQTLGEIRKCKD